MKNNKFKPGDLVYIKNEDWLLYALNSWVKDKDHPGPLKILHHSYGGEWVLNTAHIKGVDERTIWYEREFDLINRCEICRRN